MIPSFPKIFALGSKQVELIFQDEVEITEKIDGSQIAFGKLEYKGELYIRSKGAQLFVNNPEKMFSKAIDVIKEREDQLIHGLIYYGEYLRGSKHNILTYNREPKNNIALYGIYDTIDNRWAPYEGLERAAGCLNLDVVPLLYEGKINSLDQINKLINKESVLGGCEIEGIVVKNYYKDLLVGSQVIPIMMAKYVSEKFKEVHKKNCKIAHTSRGKWDIYKTQFGTEARWRKAIEHLRDIGKLTQSPKDIGNLIKEIQTDIYEEEKENIKEFLYKEFSPEIGRLAVKGFAEWYKQYLLDNNICNSD